MKNHTRKKVIGLVASYLAAFSILLSPVALANGDYSAKWLTTEKTVSGVASLKIEVSNYKEKILSANFFLLENNQVRQADLMGQDGAGKNSQVVEYKWDTTTLPNGDYTFYATTFDNSLRKTEVKTNDGGTSYKIKVDNKLPDVPGACKVDLNEANKITSRIIGRHEGRVSSGSLVLDSLQKYYKDNNLNISGYDKVVADAKAKLVTAQNLIKAEGAVNLSCGENGLIDTSEFKTKNKAAEKGVIAFIESVLLTINTLLEG